MSQMTAAARPLRAPRRTPGPVPLRVIPTRIAQSGNGAFATICIVLLTAGLIALLLLNTALAQGSLVLGDLQRDSARLADTSSNLQEEIDRSSASGALALSASQLGMVRMNQRGYIDLGTGSVSGEPEPATRNNAFPIVTSPTPSKVTAQVKKLLDSATKAAKAQQAPPAAAAAGAASGTATGTPTAPPTPGATPTGQATGQPTGQATGHATGQATATPSTKPTSPPAATTAPTPSRPGTAPTTTR
ncbi:hypothetical protein GCM10027053_40760 [Intrasporangium mesophilum]